MPQLKVEEDTKRLEQLKFELQALRPIHEEYDRLYILHLAKLQKMEARFQVLYFEVANLERKLEHQQQGQYSGPNVERIPEGRTSKSKLKAPDPMLEAFRKLSHQQQAEMLKGGRK